MGGATFKDREKYLISTLSKLARGSKISLDNDNVQTKERRNFQQRGLHNEDTYLPNGSIRYNATENAEMYDM